MGAGKLLAQQWCLSQQGWLLSLVLQGRSPACVIPPFAPTGLRGPKVCAGLHAGWSQPSAPAVAHRKPSGKHPATATGAPCHTIPPDTAAREPALPAPQRLRGVGAARQPAAAHGSPPCPCCAGRRVARGLPACWEHVEVSDPCCSHVTFWICKLSGACLEWKCV